MKSARVFFSFVVLLDTSFALIAFSKTKLYDESDFAVPAVTIHTGGNLIYVSVPAASAAITKNIMLHDFLHDEISLYDISKLAKGTEKGYYEVDSDIQQVKILNMNPGYLTAPIALWVVPASFAHTTAKVIDVSNLNITRDSVEMITVMGAEPYTLRSITEGPMRVYAIMAGQDSLDVDAYTCAHVIEQMDLTSSSDFHARVQSPLLTIYYADYLGSKTSIRADLGIENSLDFSGISFVTSPGFNGCKGQPNTFYSSLYDPTTSCTYSSPTRPYDVAISSVLYTDSAHPVTVTDNTNGEMYGWYGTTPGPNLTMHQTNSIGISWTRNDNNPLQSFLVRLIPSN
ncbi:hypothetical protein PENTCL1PPCAC_21007 [Pristionchus entomophagus]|uniref:IgGFc-binding protein N-terminal domain-containing protein n=1 Tax=Pristionchus entomophagus TaxID=358040 RepID=A0AAV5TWT8_9BILA|nr:hypothetical protein PENTCL1PPCAC_21007 [Pristionchus entomophagus]